VPALVASLLELETSDPTVVGSADPPAPALPEEEDPDDEVLGSPVSSPVS